jgi:hypothetical protein
MAGDSDVAATLTCIVKQDCGIYGIPMYTKGQVVHVKPFQSEGWPPSTEYFQLVDGGGVFHKDLLEFEPTA